MVAVLIWRLLLDAYGMQFSWFSTILMHGYLMEDSDLGTEPEPIEKYNLNFSFLYGFPYIK